MVRNRERKKEREREKERKREKERERLVIGGECFERALSLSLPTSELIPRALDLTNYPLLETLKSMSIVGTGKSLSTASERVCVSTCTTNVAMVIHVT